MIRFARDGAEVFATGIASETLHALKNHFAALDFRGGSRVFSLDGHLASLLGPDGCFAEVLDQISLKHAKPVRVLAFDKTARSNWGLGWHQDRVIAVNERAEVQGFTNWTIKSGVHHVQAPATFLESMLSLRLHIDDCPASNGALRIAPGSFRRGMIPEEKILEVVTETGEYTCDAAAGQILAMKALTLHASSPAQNPTHRRVLHIDFCERELPSALRWAHARPA